MRLNPFGSGRTSIAFVMPNKWLEAMGLEKAFQVN